MRRRYQGETALHGGGSVELLSGRSVRGVAALAGILVGLGLLSMGCIERAKPRRGAEAAASVTPSKSNEKSSSRTAPEERLQVDPSLRAAFLERESERLEMVQRQIAARDVVDPTVLRAMRRVPRHVFVPPIGRSLAYADHPVPIGEKQTISQPYIVAFMTQALRLAPTDSVLEIGTGSGYQAAVLAEIVEKVWTLEIVESLGVRARKTLESLGYSNIQYRIGDGYRGWVEEAPFDAIVVTAAPPHVPQPLVNQLKMGGRMVIPVGGQRQALLVLERTPNGVVRKEVLPVRFVPMTGEAQKEGGGPRP